MQSTKNENNVKEMVSVNPEYFMSILVYPEINGRFSLSFPRKLCFWKRQGTAVARQ